MHIVEFCARVSTDHLGLAPALLLYSSVLLPRIAGALLRTYITAAQLGSWDALIRRTLRSAANISGARTLSTKLFSIITDYVPLADYSRVLKISRITSLLNQTGPNPAAHTAWRRVMSLIAAASPDDACRTLPQVIHLLPTNTTRQAQCRTLTCLLALKKENLSLCSPTDRGALSVNAGSMDEVITRADTWSSTWSPDVVCESGLLALPLREASQIVFCGASDGSTHPVLRTSAAAAALVVLPAQVHAHLHQMNYDGGEFQTLLSAPPVPDFDVRPKLQAYFALGGRLRNTGDNYVAEACGLLCALWATPVNTHYTGYVDNRALLHRLSHPLSQLNKGRSYRFPEGLRLRMAARPIIMAIMAVLHARASHGSKTLLFHQRSHTRSEAFPVRLLSEADSLANMLRCSEDTTYPPRYTNFEERLYLVEGAPDDPEFCGTHILGNTREHVRRAQRYRTLRDIIKPGSAHGTACDQRAFIQSTQPPPNTRATPVHNPIAYFKWLRSLRSDSALRFVLQVCAGRLPSTKPDKKGDQPLQHSCLLCGEACMASEHPWTCGAPSAVKHRLVRYSSLSFTVAEMAREASMAVPATVLFVAVVMALVVHPSLHASILPTSFPVSPYILGPVLVGYSDEQTSFLTSLVARCAERSWKACNIGMLPIVLEDLLFHIMPARLDNDGKPIGRKLARSIITRLQYHILTSAMESQRFRVCELRAVALRAMTNDDTIDMRMMHESGQASPIYTALGQTRVGAPQQPLLHHPRLSSMDAVTIRKSRLSSGNSTMSLRSRLARPALSTSAEVISSVSRAVEAVRHDRAVLGMQLLRLYPWL